MFTSYPSLFPTGIRTWGPTSVITAVRDMICISPVPLSLWSSFQMFVFVWSGKFSVKLQILHSMLTLVRMWEVRFRFSQIKSKLSAWKFYSFRRKNWVNLKFYLKMEDQSIHYSERAGVGRGLVISIVLWLKARISHSHRLSTDRSQQ